MARWSRVFQSCFVDRLIHGGRVVEPDVQATNNDDSLGSFDSAFTIFLLENSAVGARDPEYLQLLAAIGSAKFTQSSEVITFPGVIASLKTTFKNRLTKIVIYPYFQRTVGLQLHPSFRSYEALRVRDRPCQLNLESNQ
jgi:hypothetical protein